MSLALRLIFLRFGLKLSNRGCDRVRPIHASKRRKPKKIQDLLFPGLIKSSRWEFLRCNICCWNCSFVALDAGSEEESSGSAGWEEKN